MSFLNRKKNKEIKLKVPAPQFSGEKEKTVEIGVPQPNENVKAINLAISELQKAKTQVCDHESDSKNGVLLEFTSPMLFMDRPERFHKCMHCGAKIKPSGWVEA